MRAVELRPPALLSKEFFSTQGFAPVSFLQFQHPMVSLRTAIAAVMILSGAACAARSVELVESFPLGTALDHDDLRNTAAVWSEMITKSTTHIDLAHFYYSDDPDVAKNGATALTACLAHLRSAAARGVRIRVLADEKFYKTYPEIPDLLSKTPNVEVRRFDLSKVTKGVLHAKYMIVDGAEFFVGSQNFDWRALEHIQELGVRCSAQGSAAAFSQLFAYDWALAGALGRGESAGVAKQEAEKAAAGLAANKTMPFPEVCDGTAVTPVLSPQSLLPPGAIHDLPVITDMIDRARQTVRVQVLTYKTRDGEPLAIDESLRHAIARGVRVELIVANWSKRRDPLKSLSSLVDAGAHVRFMNIPESAQGFIPFARVVHAKYLVADGVEAWVGTSNFEHDYFFKSRNAGLHLKGGAIPARLSRFFDENWNSTFAEPLVPGREYTPPRTSYLNAPQPAAVLVAVRGACAGRIAE